MTMAGSVAGTSTWTSPTRPSSTGRLVGRRVAHLERFSVHPDDRNSSPTYRVARISVWNISRGVTG